MTMHGYDVSHYQGGLDLSTIPDIEFVGIKATEGTSFVDPWCENFYQQAKRLSLPRMTYHFYRGNPKAEADFYLEQVAGYVGDSILALDFEAKEVIGDLAGAKAFCDRVRAKTGVAPLLYMSQSVANQSGWASAAKDYGLWVARYNDTIGPTGPWDEVVLWQYTSSEHVSGVDLDANRFYGTRETWAAYASGGKPAPDDGDDEMPSWKNIQYTTDWTVDADGEWHTLRTNTSDDGDTYYSVLDAEAYVTGTLHVTLNGLERGHEVDLRTVLVDAKANEPVKIAVQGSVVEAFAESGTTQLVLPFTVHVNDGPQGWKRKLRFQIRPYGGEKVTITGTHTRMLYWKAG